MKSKSPKPKSPSRTALEKVLETLPLGSVTVFLHNRKTYGFGDFEHCHSEDLFTSMLALSAFLEGDNFGKTKKRPQSIVKSYGRLAAYSDSQRALRRAERYDKTVYTLDESGTMKRFKVTGGKLYELD